MRTTRVRTGIPTRRGRSSRGLHVSCDCDDSPTPSSRGTPRMTDETTLSRARVPPLRVYTCRRRYSITMVIAHTETGIELRCWEVGATCCITCAVISDGKIVLYYLPDICKNSIQRIMLTNINVMAYNTNVDVTTIRNSDNMYATGRCIELWWKSITHWR